MKKIVIELKSGMIPFDSLETQNEPFNKMYGFGTEKVKYQSDLDNLVHFSHISNVVHVLMGQRPVPSKKVTIRKRNNHIDDIASNGLFKITNVPFVTYIDKEGNEKKSFYKEATQGKKCFYNSNSKIKTYDKDRTAIDGYITWDYLHKRKFYSEKSIEFTNRLKEIGKELGYQNVEKNISLVDFLYDVRKNEKYQAELVELASKCGLSSPIGNYIENEGKKGNSFNNCASSNLSAVTINQYLLYKVGVDGEVVLFMNDEDASVIENGTKVATFLDGGLAKVKSISNIYEDDIEDFVDGYTEKGFINIKDLVK